MGNTEAVQAKDPQPMNDNVLQKEADATQEARLGFQFPRITKLSCCGIFFKWIFVALCILAILKAIAEICLTVSTAITTKLFSSEQSGRMVGMVLLALLAAVTMSIVIYALVAVFRRQARPLHAATLVLFITAAIQAVVVGVAVRVTYQDEQLLHRSLSESFRLFKEENQRHVGLWSATQHELKCCGLYGPDDYRGIVPSYMAPNVPIPCCPSYDPRRSDLVQERAREVCKARRTFYDKGCHGPVVEAFRTSSHLVLGLTCSLIVLEVILAIIAAILQRKISCRKILRKNDLGPAPGPS